MITSLTERVTTRPSGIISDLLHAMNPWTELAIVADTYINLFGNFSIWREGQNLSSLMPTKSQELLAYLLLYRTQAHARDAVAERLWPESTERQSKKYLRQALWKLRSALELAIAPAEHPLLMLNNERLQATVQNGPQLDVATFEKAYMETLAVPGEHLDDDTAHRLCQAVDMYRGDLLEGWYSDWSVYERGRFQGMLMSLLGKIMGYCDAGGDYERGIEYGKRILSLDPAKEHIHRRLMQFYFLSGDRTGAIRQYQYCVVALADELDVTPEKSTTMLYEDIRADKPASISMQIATGHPSRAGRSPSHVEEMLSRFAQLEAMMLASQRECLERIQVLEIAMEQVAQGRSPSQNNGGVNPP